MPRDETDDRTFDSRPLSRPCLSAPNSRSRMATQRFPQAGQRLASGLLHVTTLALLLSSRGGHGGTPRHDAEPWAAGVARSARHLMSNDVEVRGMGSERRLPPACGGGGGRPSLPPTTAAAPRAVDFLAVPPAAPALFCTSTPPSLCAPTHPVACAMDLFSLTPPCPLQDTSAALGTAEGAYARRRLLISPTFLDISKAITPINSQIFAATNAVSLKRPRIAFIAPRSCPALALPSLGSQEPSPTSAPCSD